MRLAALLAILLALPTHAQSLVASPRQGLGIDVALTTPAVASSGASCGEPSITDLAVWLDGRDIDGGNNLTLTDGATFQTWFNKGSVFTDDPTQATVGSRPTFIASCVNGQACARFDGGDFLRGVTASNYTFLSNGNAVTMYVVWRTTSANPNSRMNIISTGGISAATRGIDFHYDDRAASSKNDRHRNLTSNGAAFIIDAETADNAAPAATWIMSGLYQQDNGSGDDAIVYVNNVSVDTAVASGAFSATAPANAMAVGRTSASAADFLTGDIAQVLIYQAAHDSTARAAVTTWVDCVYGVIP